MHLAEAEKTDVQLLLGKHMSVLSRLCGRGGSQVQSRFELHPSTIGTPVSNVHACMFFAPLASRFEHCPSDCRAQGHQVHEFFETKAGIEHLYGNKSRQISVCHADPMDLEYMYYNRSHNPARPEWITVRGSSKLEGYHPHQHACLPGTNYSPMLADAIITLFNFVWNYKHSVRNGGACDHNFYDLWLVERMQQGVCQHALGLSAGRMATCSSYHG